MAPAGIWDQVVDKVANLRKESSMLKLFTEHVKAEEMYGLTVHAVMRITESVGKSRARLLPVTHPIHVSAAVSAAAARRD